MWAILGASASGCGDTDPDGVESGGTAGSSTGDGTDSATPSDSVGPDSDGGASTDAPGETGGSAGSDGGDDGPPPMGVLAAGIAIGDVELNQGVGIGIARAGAWIEADARVAPVIGGRPALIRAAYTLAPDFEPRPVEGRLWLRDAAGGNTVLTDERMIAGPSDWSTFDGTFQWIVEPDALAADTEVRIELLEPGLEEGEPSGDTTGAALPADGFAPLEAWGDPMRIELVVVPFTCDGTPDLDLSPEALADFEAYVFNTYAVQELDFVLHDPVHSTSCSEFDAAEYDLPALREAEQADPWVYYGGLLPGGGGGYSIAIQGGDQMDYRRTFASHDWRDYGLTFDLFAHELAHNHGRDHSFEDPEYPGDNGGSCGAIGTWGWGPRSAAMPSSGYSNDVDLGLDWFDPSTQLLAPTDANCSGLPEGNRWNFNDITSYAYPYWVSAYTYAATAERIRLLSSWRAAGASVGEGTTLRLVVGPEGDLHRSAHAGARAVAHANAWARCEGGVRLPVRVGKAVRDIQREGRLSSFPYISYELPLRPEDPTVSECHIEGHDDLTFSIP